MEGHEFNSAMESLLNNDTTVPPWAKVLIGCVQGMMNIKLNTDMTAEIDTLKKTFATKEEVQSLKNENRLMKIKVAALQDEIDALEQYSRRNCLIFHGLPEEKGESTTDKILDIVHNKLMVPAITVTKRDIDRSHRLGKLAKLDGRQTRSSTSKPRPVIVKFTGYCPRYEVFAKKRNLKGSNIMVTENLTKKRYELLQKCMTALGKGNVWSYDGRITTKIENNYVVINNESDLQKLTS